MDVNLRLSQNLENLFIHSLIFCLEYAVDTQIHSHICDGRECS